MFNLFPEMLWMLLMLGAILATIVVAVKEKKARTAAARMMQSAMPMEAGVEDDALADFGMEEPAGQGEFNVDSLK